MEKVVQTAPREVLLTRDNIENLSVSVSRVALSRREFVEAATEVLYGSIGWHGSSIATAEGEAITIWPGAFDDAHSVNSEGEWISELRRRTVAKPRRAPRQSLLDRLRLYDAVFKLAGIPVGNEARREEVEKTRRFLRSLSGVTRTRYIHEVRKLRRQYRDNAPLLYGAAIRGLRVRIARETEAWRELQGIS